MGEYNMENDLICVIYQRQKMQKNQFDPAPQDIYEEVIEI